MRRCCRGEVRACPREKTPPPPPTQERRRRRRKGGEEDGGEGRRRGTMESGGEGVDGEGARERERYGREERRVEERIRVTHSRTILSERSACQLGSV